MYFVQCINRLRCKKHRLGLIRGLCRSLLNNENTPPPQQQQQQQRTAPSPSWQKEVIKECAKNRTKALQEDNDEDLERLSQNSLTYFLKGEMVNPQTLTGIISSATRGQ